MHKNLTITVEPVAGNEAVKVVKFSGEFDKAGHSEVREELDSLVKQFEGKHLIFDFGGLKFINSEGIGYLMEIHTHLMNRDKALVIVDLNSHVKDVFKTIGISEIIDLYDSLEDFLNK